MLQDKRLFYIFGSAAIIILLVFVLLSNTGRKYRWSETYEEEQKDPYGTYVLHELLESYFPDERFEDLREGLRGELPLKTDKPANYVFIGEGIFLDTSDVDRLIEFVENGNKAFISSKSIPYDLIYYLYAEGACNNAYWQDYYSFPDTSVQLNFSHPSLKMDSAYRFEFTLQNKPNEYNWHYIDSIYFCSEPESPVGLGMINDRFINFAEFKYGKGIFYLHTSPIAFTNIQLLEKSGIDYAGKVFSHLNAGTIYWDAFSRVDEEVSRKRNNSNMGGRSKLSTQSPLKYILAQPPLAWAWYLLLALSFLYLIFRAKRKQRIIPVLASNTNTSLEFISTIGSLYFLRNDHKKLSMLKMRLFLEYIRQHYHIPTNHLDEAFVIKLSSHSEIPESLISQILLYYNNIKSSNFVSEKTLIDFHMEVDKFYKNCK